MPNIKQNFSAIKEQIVKTASDCGRNPEDIILIAVSKRKPIEAIQQAIQAGARHFGENYIQEAVEKIDEIGKDAACWHFIGHLQSNKAKFAVGYFEYIHTVDSLKLAKEISKQAGKINKIQKIFLQVNIGLEDTKSGATPENIIEMARKISLLENISVQGLMAMPPYFEDPEDVRIYFSKMLGIKAQIQKLNLKNISMTHLSMGMSNDFAVAIQEGSTMIRVGTSIFGSRI